MPIIISIISLVGSEAYAQVDAEQVMTIGRNVLSMEDYALAIQYFNMAIKAKPYLSEAYYLRGLAKLQLEDYEGAEADCTMALNRNKFKTEAYKVRGFARQHLGKDSLAVEDFNHGLEYNPDDKYFLFYKAISQAELKQYEEADSLFSQLLKKYPKFDDIFIARGRMNILKGDTIAGLNDFNQVQDFSRNNIGVALLKAEMLSKKKKWKEAAEALSDAIRINPDETDLYINRAYFRYNNNNFAGAMSDYDAALNLEPQNEVALFNRALLRTEVRALTQAAQDFTKVLALNPSNFHALYNRALIYLEIKNFKNAYNDFKEIARRYPRFYPAYYAMAECQRNLGNIREMLANVKKGDELVTNYVANPKKNPLDRPTIQAGKTNKKSRKEIAAPTEEEEFMEKFNQLVTMAPSTEPELSFNDRIKGRVQDRDVNVIPEDEFSLSFIPPPAGLRTLTNSFRNLSTLNRMKYIPQQIYIFQGSPTPSDSGKLANIFELEKEFGKAITSSATPRPIDLFGRALTRIMVKNYDGAIADLSRAIENSDDFITALFARAYAYSRSGAKKSAMDDLDTIIALDPTMIYAWFNKGYLYYESSDFTSAISAYDHAISIDPEHGETYYNRGLAYMKLGNRQKAFSDLSKAGELGILQSYNILKRMK